MMNIVFFAVILKLWRYATRSERIFAHICAAMQQEVSAYPPICAQPCNKSVCISAHICAAMQQEVSAYPHIHAQICNKGVRVSPYICVRV